MKILAIDTATRIAGVAVLDGITVLGESWLNSGQNHSRKLMPLLTGLLEHLEMSLADMDCLAVSTGPGSFTGLRIGIATVQGLALATGKPVAGVPTLDALAQNLPGYPGIICPILDARKDEVYTASYRWRGGRMERVGDYRALSPRELAGEMKEQDEPVVFLGDGVFRYREQLTEILAEQATFGPGTANFLRPSAVALLGGERYLAGGAQSASSLRPFYLRASEAEVKWAQKHGGSGDGNTML